MYFVTNLSFLVVFLIKGIASTSTSDTTSTYDLTKVLNTTIVGIFRNTDYDGKAKQLINKLATDSGTFEISNNRNLEPFKDKIFFNNIEISADYKAKPKRKFCEFTTNKTFINYNEIEFTVNTDVCIDLPTKYTHFQGYITYQNLTIIATRLLTKKNTDKKVEVDISHGDLSNDQGNRLSYCDEIAYKKQQQIIYTSGMMLPSLINACFASNKIANILDRDFCQSPKQKIISEHSNFLENEHHYYYHIPTISFVYINLNNVKIRGLSNFKSYSNNETFGDDGYTLIMENITGEMRLEHGFKGVPNVELSFTSDLLYVSLDNAAKRIRVEAQDYSIVQTSSQSVVSLTPWLSKYSSSLMEQIESAMAYSLMPSIGVLRTHGSGFSINMREMERSIVQLLKNVTTT